MSKKISKDQLNDRGLLSRRAAMLGLLQTAAVGALGWRMKTLQLDQSDEFLTLAEENRVSARLLPPIRGLLTDTSGRKIADNIQNYRVSLVPEEVKDAETVLRRLAKIIPIHEDVIKDIVFAASKFSPQPIPIADHLSWEHFATISENLPALPGILPEIALSRLYRFPELFAHSVGYVGPVSDYDLSKMDVVEPVYRIPHMPIGKNGIERKLELDLRGQAGLLKLEVDAHQRVKREIDRVPGAPGDNIQLTLDADFQNYALARMKGESAAAVVMDVETGDVKLLTSTPSYNTNKFVFGISQNDYNELLENKYRPLTNKAVSGAYPPGSTFKMVVALAGLEAGVIGPGTYFSCRGYIERAGRRFHCWSRNGHGGVNLKASLKHSCDVYYYETAERVGIEKIADMARRLGLGTAPDVPLVAVSEGLIPDMKWKEERKGESWVLGDTINAGIGQGFVLTTPLQLAIMTARIASGKAITPNFVKSVNRSEKHVEAPLLDINPEHLSMVRRGMYAVSNEGGGTAYKTHIAKSEWRMSGKTGTSQVRRITKAERARGVIRNDQLPWERRDHALFVGFAPADKPKYAVAVVVEHGGGGSTAAAPIARDLMLYAEAGGPPPLEAYPSADRGRASAFINSVPKLVPVTNTDVLSDDESGEASA